MERNIYKIGKELFITSDEEIKDGWSYDRMMKSIGKRDNVYSSKIILTTDQDLIKDGVQSIDDEFLEWFVKNPSCEKIGVTFGCMETRQCVCDSNARCLKPGYEIIIPKEEPKKIKCYCGHTITCDCSPLEEPKQETLEEAAENYAKQFDYAEDSSPQIDFIEGAKWQAERRYNEEDMISFAEFVATYTDKNKNVHGQMLHAKSKYDGAERTIDLFKIWFEQHKKK